MYVWVRIVVERVHDALCVCVSERVIWVGGWVGGGLVFGGVAVCVCVVLFFKHSENICIPLNPACVALIISCMHQGFSRVEITRLKSHHTPPEEEGERCSLEPCLLQPAPFQQRGEDKRINEERRGEVRYVAVVSLRT